MSFYRNKVLTQIRLMQRNLLTRLFAIPEIRRICVIHAIRIFCQRKFWNRDEKLPRNVGAIFSKNIEKSGMRTIT